MAKLLKLRRGTTTQHSSFTGAEGECTVDMTKDTLVVHDGSTAGGHPVAAEDMANVSSSSIVGRIGTSALAGTKVNPNFGSQNITTTGSISAGTGVNITSTTAGQQVEITKDGTSAAVLGHIGTGNEGFLALKDGGSNTIVLNGETGSGSSYINSTKFGIGTATPLSKLHVVGNTQITSDLSVGGDLDVTEHISIADDKQLKLGASDDLIIFHQTSNNNSIIKEKGGGALSIQSNGPQINFYDTTNSTSMLLANAGGSVDLYNASTVRLSTASDGVDVTGSIDATTDIKTTGGAFRIDTGFYIEEESAASGSAESPDGSTIIKNGTIGKDLHLGAYGDIALGSSNSTANTVAKFQMPVLGASKHGVCYLNYVTANAGGSASSSKKFETKSTGCEVTGQLDVSTNVVALGDLISPGKIGRDTSDYIQFTDNTQLDVYVNGNNEFRFEADGDFHADGDIVAFSSTTASDSRLKSDIHTINDALGIVGKLRGVSYKWLRDGKADIGVIAQEVEEVIPEIVKTKSSLGLDGPEEIKTVDYGKLVGVLINAINELKAELDEHKKGGK